MKLHFRCLALMLALIVFASVLCSCDFSGDSSWLVRWDKMIVTSEKKVNTILISYSGGAASSVVTPVRKLDSNNIDDLLSLFRNEEIAFSQTDESLIFASGYLVYFINDINENRDDNDNVITDDTGTNFKYAVKVFVKHDGYVYVSSGEGFDRWLKSNVEVNIEKIHEHYLKSSTYVAN